ncbi:hypothetical protein ATE92_1555 [Ulvibacter sp. MAR_2010_11]|uniref:hypothetical protein n=1 Tax=Ulvibacter sp. MAR_2010_11 TaxID=1250229 RepID=UPI000C2C4A4D|nr:hypothetical protein [Ulvibacter sp. MAR_2010_11]PKA83403.1 hypothetical protein ATE92_1555 [Ulvibacter sp. MAR_2010_11]
MKCLKNICWGIAVLFLWSCDNASTSSGKLIDYVPENPVVVFKISNASGGKTGFETLQRDITTNSLLSAFKSTNPYSFLSEKTAFLKYISTSQPSLFCINTPTDSTTVFTFLTKDVPGLFVTDSIKNKTIETLHYNKLAMQRITIDDQITFAAVKDSVFIASSSQFVLQQILEGKTEKDPLFKKIAAIKNTSELTALISNKNTPISDSVRVNFASWTALDLELFPDAVTATGVAIARDTVPQLLSVFEGLVPRQNDLAQIIPTEASGALSFTYNDASLLFDNLQKFRGKTASDSILDPLFESVNEVGLIQLAAGKAIALKSIDPILTEESILKYVSEKSSFREVDIKTFSEPTLFTTTFAPLIQKTTPAFVFQLENFFVFTETESAAETIITAFKNNSCLSKMNFFEEASTHLSTSSSLLIYKMNSTVPEVLSGFFNATSASQIDNISLKNYPFAAIQFSYDRDFAHVNLVCKEITTRTQSPGGISQQFNLLLDSKLLSEPQLFSNHRTRGQDVVVQDITNKLYLISESGKILWTKNILSPIVGSVHEIDLLRNGKKQLAFTTKNAFHVIDRNGKPVGPFPIKFNDPVTQPLAVFDYDNNRKYRFAITQGKNVLLYDSQGKIVKGFTFKKAASALVLPPEHIRMGNKDYVVIAEENGTLHILNRVGSSRIAISKKFQFSDLPIAEEGSDFVVITKANTKESISQSGKITSQKLNVSNNYYFKVSGSTKVTLDDNMLRINGALAELPFGMYTPPKIFTVNRNTYISVTEIQENKVYIYSKAGKLLQGFPVYGASSIDMGNTSGSGNSAFVVKGADKEVIVYTLQ